MASLPRFVWRQCNACGWQQLIKRTPTAPQCIYCGTKNGMAIDICCPVKTLEEITSKYTMRLDC